MDNYFKPIDEKYEGVKEFKRYHFPPRIELVQYETRKVKGNQTIRAFLTILFALTCLCMIYYVLIGGV